MPETPAVAVIGSGYWGKNLVRNYHQLGALKLICDRNEILTRPDIPQSEPLKSECAHFLDCVETGRISPRRARRDTKDGIR